MTVFSYLLLSISSAKFLHPSASEIAWNAELASGRKKQQKSLWHGIRTKLPTDKGHEQSLAGWGGGHGSKPPNTSIYKKGIKSVPRLRRTTFISGYAVELWSGLLHLYISKLSQTKAGQTEVAWITSWLHNKSKWPSDLLTAVTARTPVSRVTATGSGDFVARSFSVDTITELDARRTV